MFNDDGILNDFHLMVMVKCKSDKCNTYGHIDDMIDSLCPFHQQSYTPPPLPDIVPTPPEIISKNLDLQFKDLIIPPKITYVDPNYKQQI